MPMNESALEAAARAGLYDGEHVDRPESTRRIIEILRGHQGDPLVDAQVLTIEEITYRIYDSNEPDLRSLVAQLCSLSPRAPVQRTLNGNGQMLCGRRVTRQYETDGVVNKRLHTGRFLSGDPAVVNEFLLELRAARLTHGAETLRELHDLAEHRIPALAPIMAQRRKLLLTQMQPYLLPPATQQQP